MMYTDGSHRDHAGPQRTRYGISIGPIEKPDWGSVAILIAYSRAARAPAKRTIAFAWA